MENMNPSIVTTGLSKNWFHSTHDPLHLSSVELTCDTQALLHSETEMVKWQSQQYILDLPLHLPPKDKNGTQKLKWLSEGLGNTS